jgi:hypothetical protein
VELFRDTILAFEFDGLEDSLGALMVFWIAAEPVGPESAAFNRTKSYLLSRFTGAVQAYEPNRPQGWQNLGRIGPILRPGISIFIYHDSFLRTLAPDPCSSWYL